MSAIQARIEKLRNEEKRLERETRKIEFLKHILESTKNYEDQDFQDVKADVVVMLEDFVVKSIAGIEGEPTPAPVATSPAEPTSVQTAAKTPAPKKEVEPSVAEKSNFAITNRHLGGRNVSVINDANVEIKGKVVGLDAPFVLVKTDTGPTIKVPLPNVVLQ